MAPATGSRATKGRGKSDRTWIVVADGGQARILESDDRHSGVTLRLDLTSGARLTGGKLAADRLPRTQESAGAARHSIAPRLSLKGRERQIFASRLADYLAAGIKNFDRLVLVAPTRFLKLIEERLPAKVSDRLTVARAKDLTWMSDAELLDHLGPVGAEVRRVREGASSR